MNPVGVFQFSVFFLIRAASRTSASPQDGADGLAEALQIQPARFASVSGLEAGMEVETYHEGGRNTHPSHFVRWGQFTTLTFRRGVTSDTALWSWYNQVQFGSEAPVRSNGFVLLHANARSTATAGWFFSNALPERLTGPTLDAASNQIAIESLELIHEGLVRLTPRQLEAVAPQARSA
ncbi:MAG: phage tail protein [Myxococcales bacterium]|nr:phage tail protein [Myxococcales bacterium]